LSPGHFSDPLSQGRVRDRDHAAAHGVDRFGGLEAEIAIGAEGTGRFAGDRCPVAVGAVFDQHGAMGVGDLANFSDPARNPIEMGGDHHAGAVRNHFLQRLGVHAQGVELAVSEPHRVAEGVGDIGDHRVGEG